MTNGFVVITGGPGSGKTSLVDYLASIGYATVPEAAWQIIEELNHEHGVAGQIVWRRAHPRVFQRLVLERQCALEAAYQVPPGRLVFCDRGRPDSLAYVDLAGVVLENDLLGLISAQCYSRVFLLDTLTRFDRRELTGRISDRERSLRIRQLLEMAYCKQGYAPVLVPELPIKERAHLVLEELGEKLPGD